MPWIIAPFFVFVVSYFVLGVIIWGALDYFQVCLTGYGNFLKAFLALIKSHQSFFSIPVQFQVRFLLPSVPAVGAAVGAGVVFFHAEKTQDQPRHLRGRQYLSDPKKAAKALAGELAPGDGLRIHPSLPPLSLTAETLHFFILGGVGSGKTQTLTPWIRAAQARGDKSIIHDVKGDFTSSLPSFILLAPWDRRSAVWAVAADVRSKSDARKFADSIIPDSKSAPMWPAAARQVLTGLCVFLQKTKPLAWGFQDLAREAAQPMARLLQIMRENNPEAIRALEGQNVTTAGILINLMSFLAPIFDLAAAWPKPPAAGKGFSIKKWLAADKTKARTVVLQSDKRFSVLSAGMNKALLSLAADLVASPRLPDSRERKVWFFLDEFPTLGRLDAIETLVAVGRSKGVRVVLVAQDFSQVREEYGQHKAPAWLAMVGTHIVGRSTTETARWLSEEVVGQREIERVQKSETPAARRTNLFDNGISITYSKQVHTEPVLLPSQFQSELGVDQKVGGVKMLWVTGNFALRVLLPFTNLPARRPGAVPADWTSWPAESRLPQVVPEPAPQLTQPLVIRNERDDDEPGEQEPVTPPVPARSAQKQKQQQTTILGPVGPEVFSQVSPAGMGVAADKVRDKAEDILEDKAEDELLDKVKDELVDKPLLEHLDQALGLGGGLEPVTAAIKLLSEVNEAVSVPKQVDVKIIHRPGPGAPRLKKFRLAQPEEQEEQEGLEP